jgi:hypothetical protein
MPTRDENDAADTALMEWLGKAEKEPTLEPDLPICDPHHHLWLDGAVRHHLCLPRTS